MQEPKMNQETTTEPTGQQDVIKNTEPTTHPEDNGAKEPGKLFTQEEVNKIVSDRLNRERMKAEPSKLDMREAELSRRESVIAGRDFLEKNKYNSRLIELFDVLDIPNFSRFKEIIDKLVDIVPGINEANRCIPPDMPGMGNVFFDDSIARAFRLNR